MAARFFLLLGPSGVGKTTIVRRLLLDFPQLRFPISCTTRIARPNERDDVDYFFISGEEFRARLRENYFLEWDQPHGTDFYGIPREPALTLLDSGASLIREIGFRGLRQLRAGDAAAYVTSIFLEPASRDDLRDRLSERAESDVRRRLESAELELMAARESDRMVLVQHGAAEAAYQTVAAIIRDTLAIKPT